MRLTCDHCAAIFERPPGQTNRTKSGKCFCSHLCAGASRKMDPAEKKRLASERQRRWRAANPERVAKTKSDWHLRTYDPEKARESREARKEWHRAYVAKYNVTNREAKAAYDQAYKAAEYGEFAECWLLLKELTSLIREREPSWYLRARDRGYYDNITARKREERACRKAATTP